MRLYGVVLGGVVAAASTVLVGSFMPASSTSTSSHLLQAQEVDATGPTGLIVGNLQGVCRTIDSGRHWANITPPLFASQPVLLSHLTAILTVGDDRIWLVLVGDARMNFTPYSSDGGSRWRLLKNPAVALPTTQKWKTMGPSLTARIPTGFRILDWRLASPHLGWAQVRGPNIGAFTPTYLFRTTNGGGTWTAIST